MWDRLETFSPGPCRAGRDPVGQSLTRLLFLGAGLISEITLRGRVQRKYLKRGGREVLGVQVWKKEGRRPDRPQ